MKRKTTTPDEIMFQDVGIELHRLQTTQMHKRPLGEFTFYNMHLMNMIVVQYVRLTPRKCPRDESEAVWASRESPKDQTEDALNI